MTNVAEKRLIIWRDIDLAVRVWQLNEATMNFEIFEVVAYENDADAAPFFWDRGSAAALPGTTSVDRAEATVEGFIRFDGCSHWGFQDGQMLHLCGRENLDQFVTAQRRLFDEAARLIGDSWCG